MVVFCLPLLIIISNASSSSNSTAFICCLFNADPYDYLPPPEEAVLRFQERNVNWPLCKEITIVDDCYAEVVEEFEVHALLAFPGAVGVEPQFIPPTTIVKIEDDDASKGKYYTLSQIS